MSIKKLRNRCITKVRQGNVSRLTNTAGFCKLRIDNNFRVLKKRYEEHVESCDKRDLIKLAEFLQVKIPNYLKKLA